MYRFFICLLKRIRITSKHLKVQLFYSHYQCFQKVLDFQKWMDLVFTKNYAGVNQILNSLTAQILPDLLIPKHNQMATCIQEEYMRIYKENKNRRNVCPSCLEAFENLVSLNNCGHSFCQPCLREYLKARIHDGYRKLEDFKCLEETCSAQISEVELERQMEFEYFNKLTNKVIFELHFLCPKCRQRGEFKTDEQLYCIHCYTEFCKFCKAEQHQGTCKTDTQYFNEVRAAIEDEEIGYCPQCRSPFMKDQNCDHVTCENPECKLEFCFYCWVPFESINWHGGTYHRIDCRNYEFYGQVVEYYFECQQCQKMKVNSGLQRVCSRPDKSREDFLKEIIEVKETTEAE